MVQLNPVPFFAAIKKIPEPFDGNFFTEISVLYISVKNLIMSISQSLVPENDLCLPP